jgi:phosphoglycolate phosphatase
VETLLPELAPPSEGLLHLLDAGERGGIESVGGVLYPGIAEGLPLLAASYPLFVVSNCPGWYLEAFLRISGLSGHLAAWDCHGSSGLSKPEMLQVLAGRHGLRSAVYVGDTRGDQLAAGEAGMEFAYVHYGFGDAAEPVLAFDDFTDLVDHYLALVSEG